VGGRSTSASGIRFAPNLPTEEVFTMPHKDRVDGTVRSTKPLSYGGTLIEGFSVTFAEGRVVDVHADKGEDVLRRLVKMDGGAARLGELALVPHNSPVAQTGVLFYNTLFDENAASHVALGRAYPFACEDEADVERSNVSAIHIDFMIGSEEVGVTGITTDGDRVPILRGGDWQL
jgi:aminopeptidase